MHIPDGFLDAKTALGTALLSGTGLAFALYHARRTLPPRKIPLLGLSAAFVFAAQMINFPVTGGTSGHLVGGVLAAALLGPSAAVIVLATVLIVQCFAFADGGITALGANIFNMAIIGGVGGWMIQGALTRFSKSLKWRLVSVAIAAWISTVLAAIVCSGELAASGTVAWSVAFPAMASIHALIGVGEAAISVLVLSAIASVRPELVITAPSSAPTRSFTPILVYGLLAALGIGLFVSPFASRLPDGLDWVATKTGFAHTEKSHPAPLADYKTPGIANPSTATGIAGALGTATAFGLAWLLARTLLRRKAA